MPVFRSSDPPSGNLAQAINIWNQFFGPAAKQREEERQFARNADARAQAEAQRQAESFPFQKAQQEATAGEATRKNNEGAQVQATSEDASMLAPSLVDAGTSSGKSPLSTRFWEEMDPQEQAHVLGLFTHGTQDTNLVPGAYNAWLSTTRGILPPLRLPCDLQKPGGSPSPNGMPAFGVTGYNVHEGKVSPEIKAMLPNLSEQQMDVVKKGPAEVNASPLFNQFNREQAIGAARDYEKSQTEMRNGALQLEARLASDPAVHDFNKLDRQYQNLQKVLVGKTATGSDALAAIYGFVTLLDPGSMVKEGETYMVRKTGGVWDTLDGLVRQLEGKGSLSPNVQANILATSGRLAQSAVDTANRIREGLRATASANNIDPDRVSPTPFALTSPAAAGPKATPGGPPAPSLDASAPGFLGTWQDGLPIFASEAELRTSGQPIGWVKFGTTLRKINAAAPTPVPGVPGAVNLAPISVGAPVAAPPALPRAIQLPGGGFYQLQDLSPFDLLNPVRPPNQ